MLFSLEIRAKSDVIDGTVVWVGAVETAEATGSYVVIKGGVFKGEPVCSGTTSTHQWYFIRHDSPVSEQMLSVALTSLATGKTTRIYGNNQCSGNGFENIRTIFVIDNLKYN